jgi:hypothetical protein
MPVWSTEKMSAPWTLVGLLLLLDLLGYGFAFADVVLAVVHLARPREPRARIDAPPHVLQRFPRDCAGNGATVDVPGGLGVDDDPLVLGEPAGHAVGGRVTSRHVGELDRDLGRVRDDQWDLTVRLFDPIEHGGGVLV